MNRLAPERAVLWMPADGQYDVAGVRSTRNLGRALGAPEHVQVGNGYTATTFPTQRSPRGAYFDGGDFLQVPHAQMPDLGNNFTLACLVTIPQMDGAVYGALIDKSSYGSTVNTPYLMWWEGGAYGNRVNIGIGDGVNYNAAYSLTNSIREGQSCVAVGTCDDTQLFAYVDGVPGLALPRTINSVNNASPMVVAAATPAGGYATTGLFGPVAIYPYALTPNEVRELGYRFREIARIPR